VREELFEGVVMLLAALMVTWMILWMLEHAKHVRREIERKVAEQVSKGYAIGLMLFAFLSVLREGFETVIFLGAVAFSAGGLSAIGAVGGIAGAVLLGFLIFELAMRIDLRLFFNASSALLILLAAGMTATAAHEFSEAGLIPEGEALWSTKHLLDQKSEWGSIAKAMFGYRDSPTLYEVLAWFAYMALFAVAYANREKLHGLMSLRTEL